MRGIDASRRRKLVIAVQAIAGADPDITRAVDAALQHYPDVEADVIAEVVIASRGDAIPYPIHDARRYPGAAPCCIPMLVQRD
jgi:hypothetical protein